MSYTDQDRTLALAGVFQAAHLAQELARRGRADTHAYGASLYSILCLEAEATAAVYGGVRGLAAGLALVRDKLAGPPSAGDLEFARYVLGMMQLAARLQPQVHMQEQIKRGIERARAQSGDFAPDGDGAPETAIETLADLYTQTISTLQPRILVNGEHSYLTDTAIVNRVRTALFAGIRAAFLWHQVGGRRWQLIFRRAALVRAARKLLEDIDAETQR